MSSSDPGDTPEDIERDILAVGRIAAVPALLQIVCKTTGMGFAAIARVSDATWTSCAVHDELAMGLLPGSQLDIRSTLCIESKAARAPIIIDDVHNDPCYQTHPTPKLFGFQSYISVPIILAGGRYFGSLYAVHRSAVKVSESHIVFMFERFAELIAGQLDAEFGRQEDQLALRDERATSELRDQFIAILGHDLRNPLQAVFATSELLERRLTDPSLNAMAARIRISARRMSALIDDVLDFARGRLGGGIHIEAKEIDDVEDGLTTVIKELQDARPDRQVIANMSVTRAVRCDIARLQQVASNLIGNAIAHGTPEGAVEVNVNTNDEDLVLEVWNDGEPISPDSIAKIFKPFWRNSARDNREGLGLGLHICSEIVRAHGGRISVTSTKAAGTRFTARLPLST